MTIKAKKEIFIFICFAIIITSILPLFTSNDYPSNELSNHVVGIVQARKALDEGQFPPRTAPDMQKGFGYPIFQFYSPLFYTTSGLINKFIVTKNAFISLKIVIWLSLFFGLIYTYRLLFLITESYQISFLSSIVYLVNPWFFTNIFGFGHVTETAAQGIIPIAIYYNLKVYFSERLNIYLMLVAAFSWFMLLCVHPVTFFYFSVFFFFFLFIFTFVSKEKIRKVIFCGFSYIYGLLLGAYYFLPTLVYTKQLSIGNEVGFFDKVFSTFLTPLSTLLSFSATAPMPLPGNNWIAMDSKLYISIGLIIFIGIGLVVYAFLFRRDNLSNQIKAFLIALLCCFFCAFFAAWTPIYFWDYLPKIFQIGQFTYRLMTQIIWMGTLCFGLILYGLFKHQLNGKYVFFISMLIFLSIKSWSLRVNEKNPQINIQEVQNSANMGGANENYLFVPKTMRQLIAQNWDSKNSTCKHEGKKTICNFNIQKDNDIVFLPVFYYPKMLKLKVNDSDVEYFPADIEWNSKKAPSIKIVALKLSQGEYKVESYFQGLVVANWISITAFFFFFLIIIQRYSYRLLLHFNVIKFKKMNIQCQSEN